MLTPTDPISTKLNPGTFDPEANSVLNQSLKSPKLPVFLRSLAVQTEPAHPAQPAKFDTSIYVKGKYPVKADLVKLPDELTFSWRAATMKSAGLLKVQVAYQVLSAALPEGAKWENAPGKLGEGIVETVVDKTGDGGIFKLNNAAWQQVNWALAPTVGPDNAELVIVIVQVRMVPMGGKTKLAPPSACVQVAIGPPFVING